MLLNEQKYTNKNRLYYRGLKKEDLTKKGFNETYLTTNIVYALSYAKINGIIEVYRLKNEANIFNMKSKQDEANLRKYCNSHMNQYKDYLKTFEKLKDNDWSKVMGGTLLRQPLIIAIKTLGYDGYFNYEIDGNFFNETKKYFWNIYEKPHVNFPSIAIFNDDIIEKVDTLKGEKLLENEKIKKINSQEKGFALSFKPKDNSFDFVKNNTLTLSDEEINKIIKMKNLNKEQVDVYLESLRWDLGY